MARDRKSALKASIQAEKVAVQERVPTYGDRFTRAEAVLKESEQDKPPPRKVKRIPLRPTTATPVRKVMIRDSFTMPEGDYKKIAALRARCLEAGRVVINKGEVLRAGLLALERMKDKELLEVVGLVEKMKPGRPGKYK